jgi:membrane protease YdiL (CAAX protease family)
MTSKTSSVTKRWKDFFVKDDRLRSGWRAFLYIPVLAVTYFVLILPFMLIGINLRYSYSQLLQVVAVIVGTWLCRRFIDRRDFGSLGFRFDQRALRDIGIGLALGMVLTGGIFVVELVFGWIDVKGFVWQVQPIDYFASNFLWDVVIQMVCVAVLEETISRGYLLPTLEEGLGLPWAIVITSCLFGVAHLLNPSAEGWVNYVIPFTLTLAGIELALAYLVRRSLWLPIALHFSWNVFLYYIFGLTGESPEYARFIITEVTGPAIWVGLPNSAFGPEVGLLGILATLISIGILILLRQRSQIK